MPYVAWDNVAIYGPLAVSILRASGRSVPDSPTDVSMMLVYDAGQPASHGVSFTIEHATSLYPSPAEEDEDSYTMAPGGVQS